MSKNTIPDKTYKIAHIENMVMDGLSRKEIAYSVGYKSVRYLMEFCHNLGIEIPTSDQKMKVRNRKKHIDEFTNIGYSRGEIADALGLKIHSLIEWACRNNISLPPSKVVMDNLNKDNVVLRVSIPSNLMRGIIKEAHYRNYGIVTLASSIIQTVARDNLYNAVLEL